MPPAKPAAKSTKAKTTVVVEKPHGIPYRAIFTAVWIAILSGAFVLLVVQLKTVIFHLVLAVFIALVLNPAVTRLQRFMKRGKAIALVIVGVSLGAAGIGTAIAAPLASQAVNIAQNAPEYIREASTGQGPLANVARRFHLENQLEKSAPTISKRLSRLSTQVIGVGRRIASGAFTAAIVLILAIFMLVEGPKLVGDFVAALPEDRRDAARRIGHSTTRVVSGYTLGVLFMATLNGLVAAIALGATGTPFVIPLAVWAAVVDILPIVGGLFAIVPAALFAFGHSLTAGIIVVVAMLVYQQVKNHVLYPVLVGRAVNLNSLLVLIAVLVGADLGHVAGAILAIPIVGTLQTVVVEAARIRSGGSVAGEPEAAPREKGHGLFDRLSARIARRKGV
ncbi:MAG: AI-2E family transporter [Actinomycetota bacterium]|nr:AI-2E family transporter [Actinomycetota bacterium]